MKNNLFLTTAIVTVSLIANSATAKDITDRQVIQRGEKATFDDINASNLLSDKDGAVISNDGTVTISNSEFIRNKALDADTSAGGAIANSGVMDISSSAFNKNQSGWGGAIKNTDELTLTDVTFFENKADAYNRDFGGTGGAIFNYWQLKVNGGAFTKNSAFDGGAIFNRYKATVSSTFTDNTSYLGGAVYNEDKMTISNSVFTGNSATEDDSESELSSGYGGAVYNEGTLDISDSAFNNNEAVSKGGALYNTRKAVITGSSFTGNEVERYGGAVYNESKINVSEPSMIIDKAVFTANKSMGTLGSPSLGGAVFDNRGKLIISNSVFDGNEAIGSAVSGGGAVYTDSTIDGEQNPLAITEISDTKFVNNKAAWGGAVENGGQTDMTNVTFTGNRAEYRTDDGGDGGAVYNGYHAAGPLTITNGTFTDNSATGNGGAISNSGTLYLKGQNIFEGNRDGNGLNDIHNEGKLNIVGDITLDGGISGYRGLSNYGTVVFADGSSLTVKAGTTTISKNNVKNNGANIHFNIGNGFAGDYALITENSTLDNEFTIADNNLYNITATDTKGTYTISKKSSSEVAESLDVSSNDAAAITAITDGESQNGLFNKISDYVNDLIQSGNAGNIKTAVAATRALAPEVAPMVQQTQSETANQIYNAVGKRLSGGTSGASQGIASGDVMKDISIWIQGLANHAKLDRTAKFAGFKADTYGVALGAEKKLDTDIKAGVGYAYSKTDIDAKGRDTDVKTHTLLAYGEYKPSAWFVNGIISYGWSDYDEDKKVAGNRVNAEYEIKTFGLQAMTGYDLYTQYATVTPEAGLRYLRINGGHYTDEAGQTVASSDSNIITGVIGSKVSKTFDVADGWRLTPEAGLALTYDLKRAKNKSNITLPNGSSYSIDGKNLSRFGVEIGGDVKAEFNDNIEMSLGYEGGFRKDYQNHSVLVNLKYNF